MTAFTNIASCTDDTKILYVLFVSFTGKVPFCENITGYFKNHWTKTWHVCTYFYAFAILIPNMNIKSPNSDIFKNIFLKNLISVSFAWHAYLRFSELSIGDHYITHNDIVFILGEVLSHNIDDLVLILPHQCFVGQVPTRKGMGP